MSEVGIFFYYEAYKLANSGTSALIQVKRKVPGSRD